MTARLIAVNASLQFRQRSLPIEAEGQGLHFKIEMAIGIHAFEQIRPGMAPGLALPGFAGLEGDGEVPAKRVRVVQVGLNRGIA